MGKDRVCDSLVGESRDRWAMVVVGCEAQVREAEAAIQELHRPSCIRIFPCMEHKMDGETCHEGDNMKEEHSSDGERCYEGDEVKEEVIGKEEEGEEEDEDGQTKDVGDS